MAFWDKLKGELIDIVEWLDDSNNTLVHRFERYGNEIKYGAKLVVREGQAAIFVNEGKLADVFTPGTYTLETKNVPILSTLKGWVHGFESPFKAEVYFVSTRRFVDQKWGTKNPITLRDAEFGPVRLRAFGTYGVRVTDPAVFLREIVGTDGHFTTEEIVGQLRNLIVSRFSDAIGESRIPVLDMAANYDELGEFVGKKISPDFTTYGLEVVTLMVENISLPPAVEEALDKRSSMGILGNLDQYTKFQAATAMEKAAENSAGGGAAEGMGLGMGFAMAGQMAHAMQPSAAGGSGGGQAPPPPPPPALTFHVAVNGQTTGPFDLNTLKLQAQSGAFTRASTVWREGQSGWLPAGQVTELNPVFATVPPPPPPPPPGATPPPPPPPPPSA
ncbi:SPFH domain-containing protein [Synoicihabitans lomoniglobus]|uniref:SPFH domain-containing protein n=1 Tax=Synoicihabitans lomoniglobus TaxID=2909285 RepID=A0AAE9ZXE3_9BACT|nr:SPFH domain-containing protein [Opitutaceae bacterium LMO-M01]WED65004.1 SPFH domain-containing protein [Opitutaceae bacterium LMO-M01]